MTMGSTQNRRFCGEIVDEVEVYRKIRRMPPAVCRGTNAFAKSGSDPGHKESMGEKDFLKYKV